MSIVDVATDRQNQIALLAAVGDGGDGDHRSSGPMLASRTR